MLDPLNDQLPARLTQRLAQPLPGRRAHRRMSAELAYGRHAGPPAWDARPAAVLVCLYVEQDGWHIPLTLRPDHMIDHAGQISFPGGTNEPNETPEACALREFEEELGAATGALTLLGRLTPLYVFASNFLVTPCVAVAASLPELNPNPGEVQRVLRVPFAVFREPVHYGSRMLTRRGISFRTQTFRCGGDIIWGATAMMLAELAELVASD